MTRTSPMPAYGNVLDLIGDTPLVKLTHLDTGVCELFAKLECNNPAGSIKDRIGLRMIEAAERDGKIKPGGTIVEATAGNTGLGLALAAIHKGYKLLLVIPDKMSQEKIFHLRAMGVEIVMTRSDVSKGHPEYYQDMAKRIAAEMQARGESAFCIDQFSNPSNQQTHEDWTAPEIWEQMEHRLDAVVAGVGSGGTITGMGRFFQRVAPHVEMVLADPKGSILNEIVNTGTHGPSGSWLVEGIGGDYVPANLDIKLAKKAYAIGDGEALLAARELLQKEGIMGGSSTGTLLATALRYCREQTTPKRVVTIVCDVGGKYLSKMYNDYWLVDQGIIERPAKGDLSDLVARRHNDRATITIKSDDTLQTAYARMKLYDFQQLPVLDNDTVIGIIDESDILMSVIGDESRFTTKVVGAMTEKIKTIQVSEPVAALLPIFDKGYVAIVNDGDKFLGLITRYDLLNYLRRRAH
ncbi:MAG: pyridoxal-phosphate dependent enzyme [Burkholderiales bacterium]|nr:pyridoxal-phosphate dependent enzyme [Burkholderiales bacterium]